MSNIHIIETNLIKLSKTIGFEFMCLPLNPNNKLRSDLTSALATIPSTKISPLNYKYGQVFRSERHIDLGRTNQFEQFDFDIVGIRSPNSEMLLHLILNSLLSYFNLDLCNLVIGNINILNGVCDILGINCYPTKKSNVISILDKSSNLNYNDLKQLLTTSKHNENNTVICNIDLPLFPISNILSTFWSHTSPIFSFNMIYTNLSQSYSISVGIHELFTTVLISTITGMNSQSQMINPLLARGLLYYTANIFELQPITPCCNLNNVFVRVGSLLAGGRYDDLINNIQGSVPSSGYSIGISRLLEYHYTTNNRFKSLTINTTCICWSQGDCYNPKILTNITNLRRLGFKIKLLGSMTFLNAIKLATNADILMYSWQNGWLIKNMTTRQHLDSKITSFKLWKHTLSDQFWTKELT
ncbi:Histidine--tRNA ligase [Candidatus Hodgkinia cicadicola]|uniref:Histidine--tRNA ligase n=1 Tax=Candidatus Hodgkinia cicadicola TaxID=573658 RepID=A0ABX4MFV7_9HYPH|nr:Histidine--tRNA ligase [Candidatus Hodgkinia cicadicola]